MVFDRSWVATCPVNGAPAVQTIHLGLPDGQPELEIEAWTAGYGGGANDPPVLILEGDLTLTQAQGIVTFSTAVGQIDALLIVPGGATGVRRRLDPDMRVITVYWASAAGGANTPHLVQVRVKSVG